MFAPKLGHVTCCVTHDRLTFVSSFLSRITFLLLLTLQINSLESLPFCRPQTPWNRPEQSCCWESYTHYNCTLTILNIKTNIFFLLSRSCFPEAMHTRMEVEWNAWSQCQSKMTENSCEVYRIDQTAKDCCYSHDHVCKTCGRVGHLPVCCSETNCPMGTYKFV